MARFETIPIASRREFLRYLKQHPEARKTDLKLTYLFSLDKYYDGSIAAARRELDSNRRN